MRYKRSPGQHPLRFAHIASMREGMAARKPTDDLKEGLFLLYRAARGAAREIDTKKIERALTDGTRELARVMNNVGNTLNAELEKTFGVTHHDSPPASNRNDDSKGNGPNP